MPRMTDEEADALDELVTRNPPQVSGDGKSGFFMRHKGNIVILDDRDIPVSDSPVYETASLNICTEEFHTKDTKRREGTKGGKGGYCKLSEINSLTIR